MIRLCGSMHEGVLNIKLLKARALLGVIFFISPVPVAHLM